MKRWSLTFLYLPNAFRSSNPICSRHRSARSSNRCAVLPLASFGTHPSLSNQSPQPDSGAEKKSLCLALGADQWIDFKETSSVPDAVISICDGLGAHAALVTSPSVRFGLIFLPSWLLKLRPCRLRHTTTLSPTSARWARSWPSARPSRSHSTSRSTSSSSRCVAP